MALNINGTTGISGVDGSASAPAIQGTDSNTGINFASDTVNINTAGVTRVIVDSSGNLKAGTITDTSGNNSSTTAEIAQGRAKAWCNVNGGVSGGYEVRDSFNMSSVTDTATGTYTVNLASAMANTNYCVVSSGHYAATAQGNVREVGATALATGTFVLQVSYNGSTLQDATNVFCAVFGD